MQFPVLDYPAVIEQGVKPYQHLFSSDASFNHIKRYLTGLMIADHKSVVGMTSIFHQPFNQSSLNRFLTQYAWDEKQLNDERIKNLESDQLRKTKPKNSVIGIDDTLNQKYGSKTPGVGTFFDHKTNGFIKAHNIVTSQYADRNNTFAINFRKYIKYPKQEKQQLEAAAVDRSNKNHLLKYLSQLISFRVKEHSFKDKQQLFRELVDDTMDKELSFEAWAFDNWYFNKDNTDHIQSYKHRKYWLTWMKSNTIVLHQARRTPVKEWAEQITQEKPKAFKPHTVKSQTSKTTYWCYSEIKKISMLAKQRCRIVVSYDNPELKGSPVFICTNNLSWDIQHILDLYSLRWPVETFYRESKLHLGLEDYQIRSTQGTERHWYLVFLLDIILGSVCRQSALSKHVQGRARTIGEQCRAAVNEAFKSLICWIYQKVSSYENPELLCKALIGMG